MRLHNRPPMTAPAHPPRRCWPHAAWPSRATRAACSGRSISSVDAGEALLVQGDNGAGKTTLLRVLAGLLRADAGEIDIDGTPSREPTCARARSPTSATCRR